MILVTGASGHLATATLEELSKVGESAIRASRSSTGAGIRAMDFDEPATISFAGVDTLLLVSAGADEDDVVIARHENAITAAERDGVNHIVYTSLTAAGDHLGFALAHRWTERRLQRGKAHWTILRNGLYAELIGHLLAPRDGIISAPFGRGGVAAVARKDLAEAAAIILKNPAAHQGRTYDLAGHRTITAPELAALLQVSYTPGTLGNLRRSLESGALLPFQSAMLISIHSAACHGFLAETADDLTQLLGREPLDPLHVAAAAASS